MRQYTSLKQRNNGVSVLSLILAICVLLSATLLFSRLMDYTTTLKQQRIPLTKSSGITHVTSGTEPRAAAVGVPRILAASPRLLTAKPGAATYDDNTIWSGETDVEIFRISYDNATGETTVRSQNGDKLLAPGVGGSYAFYLENTGNVTLDYTMEMEASFSSRYAIPVNVAVTKGDGSYLLGAAQEMVDVLRLNEVQESGTVSAGYIQPYTLHWEWPFEENDEYDTMLGNLAVDEPIFLTITIRTTAQYNGTPGSGGGMPPQTGDTAQLGMYVTLLMVSLAGLLLLLCLRRKEETNEAS